MLQLYYEILTPKDLVEYYNRNRAIIESTKNDYNYLAPNLESGTVGAVCFYNEPFTLVSVVPELLRVKLTTHSDYLCYYNLFIERTRYLFKLSIDKSIKMISLQEKIITFKDTFDVDLIRILSLFPNPRALDAKILVDNPSLDEYRNKYYQNAFQYSNNKENYSNIDYTQFVGGISKSNIIQFLSLLYEDVSISNNRISSIDLRWYLFSIHLKLYCGYNIYTLFNDGERDVSYEDAINFLLGEHISDDSEDRVIRLFKSISPDLSEKEKKEALLHKRRIINNQRIDFEQTLL